MVPSRRNPTHPGEILEEEFLKPLNLTPRSFAQKLGGSWTELHVAAIINGQQGISPETAAKFAETLGTTPDFWLKLDQQYYQWEKIHHHNKKASPKEWKKAQ